MAALARIAGRSTVKANFVTSLVETAAQYSIWLVGAPAITSLIFYSPSALSKRGAKQVS